jgi:hypothetical protein
MNIDHCIEKFDKKTETWRPHSYNEHLASAFLEAERLAKEFLTEQFRVQAGPVFELTGEWFYVETWSDCPSDFGPFATREEAHDAYSYAYYKTRNR